MTLNKDGSVRNGGRIRADAITSERPWVEYSSTVGVVGARDRLVELGVSSAQAAGIALWLADQAARRRFTCRSRVAVYRRVLESLPLPLPAKVSAIPGYRESAAA